VTEADLARLEERIAAVQVQLEAHERQAALSARITGCEERLGRVAAALTELQADVRGLDVMRAQWTEQHGRRLSVVTNFMAVVITSPVTALITLIVGIVWLIATNHVK